MKTGFVKYSLIIIAFIVSVSSSAQDKPAKPRGYTSYSSENSSGNTTETIKISRGNVEYKLKLVNDTITELYVDGKLVPAEQYSQYLTVIADIKEEMRLAKIQAKKDHERALVEQKKAEQEQLQAKIAQEGAMQAQANAKIDQERAAKSMHEAKLDQQQAEANQQRAKLAVEKAMQAQANAEADQKRALNEMLKAKRNQEQAEKDQQHAKIAQELAIQDQARAEEDQRQVQLMLSELVKDGIVSDEKSLVSLEFSSAGMFVNGKKQTDEVYKRYKEKYSKFATGYFHYSNDKNGKNIQMHRE